jgi:hypothetical protein
LVDSRVTKVTSTDNAIVRFDGTNGDVRNSGVLIDNENRITTSRLKITNGAGQDKILISDSNGEATWTTNPALKEYTSNVPLNGKVNGDWVEVYNFTRSASLQGIFEIYMLVSGSGYGTTTKFELPVTYTNDYLKQYRDPSGFANNVWHDITPSLFSGRHLLKEQDGVKVQMLVNENILKLRVKVGVTISGSPSAQFSIRHNANFEGYTVTDLTANTGNDLTTDPVLPLILTAPAGDVELYGDIFIKKSQKPMDTNGDLNVEGKINAKNINFSGLPTSDSGLSTGDVWNDGGTLKIK